MANITPTFLTEVMVQAYKRGRQDAQGDTSILAGRIRGYFERRSNEAYGPTYVGELRSFERGLCEHLLHHLGLA